MILIQGQDGTADEYRELKQKIYEQSYGGLKEVCTDILEDW